MRNKYEAIPDIDFGRFEHEFSPNEQAGLLETATYQVLRTNRVVRMVTQLVAFGMALTLVSLGYSIMVGLSAIGGE